VYIDLFFDSAHPGAWLRGEVPAPRDFRFSGIPWGGGSAYYASVFVCVLLCVVILLPEAALKCTLCPDSTCRAIPALGPEARSLHNTIFGVPGIPWRGGSAYYASVFVCVVVYLSYIRKAHLSVHFVPTRRGGPSMSTCRKVSDLF
jgi:hypothetical protein